MKKPIVSIITRTKDREPFLLRAKESIYGQSFNDFEWIIVNDGGTKNLLPVLFKDSIPVDYQVREISLKPNKGRPSSANAGIDAAQGKYIVLHDDDDTWDKSFLMKSVSFLERNDSYCGVVVHTNRIDEKINERTGQIQEVGRYPENTFVKNILISDMVQRNLFSPIAFLFKREAWSHIGGYREDLPVMEDYDFNLRLLLEVGDIGLIKECLANHHFRWGSHQSAHYNNTVTIGLDEHDDVNCVYKNTLLREDMRNNNLGLGVLLAVAGMTVESSELYREAKKIKGRLNKLKNIISFKWLRGRRY